MWKQGVVVIFLNVNMTQNPNLIIVTMNSFPTILLSGKESNRAYAIQEITKLDLFKSLSVTQREADPVTDSWVKSGVYRDTM